MRCKKSKIFRIISVFTIAIFAWVNSAYCQVGAATPTPQVLNQDIDPTLPSPGNITVNFKDVDIKTVLNYLSEISGVDIVPTPGVEGLVTMKLRDKPWLVALDIVTRNHGYTFSQEEDIIRVMPKSMMQTESSVTEVIPLNYIIKNAEAEEEDENITKLMESIDSVINVKAGEKATFLPSANAIVVTAIPARISVIKEMMGKIDKKTPQIMLDAKVIEITLDRNDQFGVDWNAVVAAAGARSGITAPFFNTGGLPGLPSGQRHFLPEAVVVNGVGTTVSGLNNFPVVDVDTNQINPTTFTTATNSANLFSFGTLDFTSFQATLRLIDQWDDTDTLSSPRITTLNNQTAVIKVINNVYLQKQQKTTDTAAIVTVEFEEKPREIGVVLTVTPHVNDKEEITVDLKPQVSNTLTFTELSVNNVQNTVAMRFNSREADTQVMVKDGETIFIGGLITETLTKQDHKVPFFGDMFKHIPLLGPALNYEQDNVDKTEIVFFVTVHLIKDGKASVDMSKSNIYYDKYYTDNTDKGVYNQSYVEKRGIVKKGKLALTGEKIDVPLSKSFSDKDLNKKRKKALIDFRTQNKS